VVVAAAFVLALILLPASNGLILVSGAGFLVIGSCVTAAIVQGDRDRRPREEVRPTRATEGWVGAVVAVAVLGGLGTIVFEKSPRIVGLGSFFLLCSVPTGLVVLIVTRIAVPEGPPDGHEDVFWRVARRNLGLTAVVIAVSLVAVMFL
jgi:hypothetical protein